MRRRALTAGVVLLSLTSLFSDIATESIYPLLPVYLTTILGAGALSLGLIEGLAETTAGILKLYSGKWSDRLGRRKPLVIGGYTLSAVMKPLIGLTRHWPQVLVLRFLDRVGKGIRSAPRDAWLGKLAEPDTMPTVFGFHRAMDNLGAFIGPMAATAFLFFHPGQIRGLFLWAIIPGILSVACLFIPSDPPEIPVKAIKEPTRADWSALPAPVRNYLTIAFLFALANSTDTFLILRLQGANIAIKWIPAIWGILNLIKSISSLYSGKLVEKIGLRRSILTGWLIYATVYFGFALLTHRGALIGLFLFYGLFFGLTEGPERALMGRLAPKSLMGTVFGYYALVGALSALPASLIFGLVWKAAGPAVAFAMEGVIALGAAGVFVGRFRGIPEEGSYSPTMK